MKKQPQAVIREHDADCYIGEKVRYFRILMGLSQQELAAPLGITFQQLQKYERGVNRIGAGRLCQIAQVLGVTVPDLLPVSVIARPPEIGEKAERMLRYFTRLEGTPYQAVAMKLTKNLAEAQSQRP